MNGLDIYQQLYLDDAEPKLRSGQIVTFWAKDPTGKREVFLNGRKKIYAIPGVHCDHFIQVTMTSRPKIRMS